MTINGTGLFGITGVRFNGTAATTFTSLSATQVRATVPAGATTGAVSVTTLGGIVSSPTSFTVSTGGTSSTTVSFNPTSLAFGNVGLGGGSTRTISVSNTGTSSLTVSGVAFTGSPVFTIASNTCTAAIAAGRNCSIGIRFTPSARTPFSGALVVTSNAAGSPATIPLSGTGV